MPATSEPGVKGSGGLNWYLFSMISTSGKLTAAALTSITTSPAPRMRGRAGFRRKGFPAARTDYSESRASSSPYRSGFASILSVEQAHDRAFLSLCGTRSICAALALAAVSFALPFFPRLQSPDANPTQQRRRLSGARPCRALRSLKPIAEVTVMAPEQNCSGASNSLTLSRPLSIHALGERLLLRERHAYRLGAHRADRHARPYSRTWSSRASTTARTWARTRCIPAPSRPPPKASCSACPPSRFRWSTRTGLHLEDAVRVAAEIVAHYLEQPMPGHPLLNVNIPNLPYEQLGEWQSHAARQAASVAAGDPPDQSARRIRSTGSGRRAARSTRAKAPISTQSPTVTCRSRRCNST